MSRQPALASPNVLKWAREDAGYELDELATLTKISPQLLVEAESGKSHLSMAQLRKVAKECRRPSAFFFLPTPPQPIQLPDFRHLPRNSPKHLSANLRFAIRNAYSKRDVALELDDAGFGPTLDWGWVGSASIFDDAEELGRKLRETLMVTAVMQTDWAREGPSRPFAHWCSAIRDLGVLLFPESSIDMEEMRGFCIAEAPFPVLVVNNKDAYSARCFTLMHEMAHLFLGASAISNQREPARAVSDHAKIEVFCNHVAGAALVPMADLLGSQVVVNHTTGSTWSDTELQKLGRRVFGVSEEVVLRRLLLAGKTTKAFYAKKRAEYAARQHKKSSGGGGETGPKKALRVYGRFFTQLVLGGWSGGQLSTIDVSGILNVKVHQLPDLQSQAFTSGSVS